MLECLWYVIKYNFGQRDSASKTIQLSNSELCCFFFSPNFALQLENIEFVLETFSQLRVTGNTLLHLLLMDFPVNYLSNNS